MSQNRKADGCTLSLVAPYERTSGQGAKVGSIFGVADGDYLETESGEFHTEGVFELTKTTSQAWTCGDKAYWNDSTKKVTTDSAAGMLIGVVTVDAASNDTTGYVKLCDTSDMAEGPQAAVVTLTDSTGLDGTHNDTISDCSLTGTLTGTANGSLADVAAAAGSCAGGATPSAAEVDTAIATAVATIVSGVNEQNKEIQAALLVANQNFSDLSQKVIEILARLVAAGVIDA